MIYTVALKLVLNVETQYMSFTGKMQFLEFEPTVFRLTNKVRRFAKKRFFTYLRGSIQLHLSKINKLKNKTKSCLKPVGFANLEKCKGDKK